MQKLASPWNQHSMQPYMWQCQSWLQQDVHTFMADMHGYLCCRAEAGSPAHLPPVRSACTPVAVQFTKLETDHLPARETREQEISSYKRKAMVSSIAHCWLAPVCFVTVLLRTLPTGRLFRHNCNAVDLQCWPTFSKFLFDPSPFTTHTALPLLYWCGRKKLLYMPSMKHTGGSSQ